MSITKFVEGLDKEQLRHAKEQIELRLNKYADAKKIKFASLVYGECRHSWVDTRDEEGWKLLEQEYVKAATKCFPNAVSWCCGNYKGQVFREELPSIEIVEVSELDYDEWLKDSLNPSFKIGEQQ